MQYCLLNFRTRKKEFFIFQTEEGFSISPARRELLVDNNVIVVGFALRMFMRFKFCNVGLFVVNRELILSIQNMHWVVTDKNISIKSIRNKYPGIDCFHVLEGNKVVFQHYYLNHFLSQPLNWVDFITYDPDEDELTDFFLWIGNVCNDKDWINRAKEEWINNLNK